VKPWLGSFAVVTATASLKAAAPAIRSWQAAASFSWPLVIVLNGSRETGRVDGEQVIIVRSHEFLGSVPAFRTGLDAAATLPGLRSVACFHDDLHLRERGWDATTYAALAEKRIGLVGYGCALGLGSDDLYQTEYNPMQLARQGFISNLANAEQHGIRSLAPQRVACCDGFALVGRASWWLHGQPGPAAPPSVKTVPKPWHYLAQQGLIHHAYDSFLGLLAHRAGWETWYQPVACDHTGGGTAVANPGYAAWANPQGGDGAFWEQAHKVLYRDGRGVLPLRMGR
jgi:hypothetical protein